MVNISYPYPYIIFIIVAMAMRYIMYKLLCQLCPLYANKTNWVPMMLRYICEPSSIQSTQCVNVLRASNILFITFHVRLYIYRYNSLRNICLKEVRHSVYIYILYIYTHNWPLSNILSNYLTNYKLDSNKTVKQ